MAGQDALLLLLELGRPYSAQARPYTETCVSMLGLGLK